jgi:hypothetical protein
MAVLASLARALGFGTRCHVVAASAEGPLFDRRPRRGATPPQARGQLVASGR